MLSSTAELSDRRVQQLDGVDYACTQTASGHAARKLSHCLHLLGLVQLLLKLAVLILRPLALGDVVNSTQ